MDPRRLLGSVVALGAFVAALFLYVAHPVRGSDHQDAPAQLANPLSDITDVYLFPDTDHSGNVILAMDVAPLLTPGSQTTSAALDPNLLYEFKISHTFTVFGNTKPEDTVIQIKATGSGPTQSISLYGPTPPDITGTQSILEVADFIGGVPFNRLPASQLSNGSYVYVGPRADPFFFDLFQFFKILPDRYYANPRTGNQLGSNTPSFNGFKKNTYSGAVWGDYLCSTAASQNALTQAAPPGFNVLTILVSVPISLLAPHPDRALVHVWADVSKSVGTYYGQTLYQQEERLARPAVKELFEHYSQHQVSNGLAPYNDHALATAIGTFNKHVARRSSDIQAVLSTILIPDEMLADLSQTGVPAAYLGVETGGATGSKFGGRGLTDNVIDTSLGAVFGGTIPALGLARDDFAENTCLSTQHVVSGQGGHQTQTTFPYFYKPH
jgi:Domain of unknown function (DUF4331)